MKNPKVGERCRYREGENDFYDGTIEDIIDNQVKVKWDGGILPNYPEHRTHLIRLVKKPKKKRREIYLLEIEGGIQHKRAYASPQAAHVDGVGFIGRVVRFIEAKDQKGKK